MDRACPIDSTRGEKDSYIMLAGGNRCVGAIHWTWDHLRHRRRAQ